MIVRIFRLDCDNCKSCKRRVHSFDDEAYSNDELRELATENGWTRRLMEHNGYWDFCPECTKEDEELRCMPEFPHVKIGS